LTPENAGRATILPALMAGAPGETDMPLMPNNMTQTEKDGWLEMQLPYPHGPDSGKRKGVIHNSRSNQK
jgi:hypothetical protein